MKKTILIPLLLGIALTGCATKLTKDQECIYLKRRMVTLINLPEQDKYFTSPAELESLRARYKQLGC